MTEPRVRPPQPLSPQLRELLADYRRAEEIPAEVEDRIWSVVGAEEAPVAARPRRAAVPRRADRRVLGWAVFGVAAAAVLVIAWQQGGLRAERRRLEATSDAAVMQGGVDEVEGAARPRATSRSKGGASVAPPAAGSAEAEGSPAGSTAEPAEPGARVPSGSRVSSGPLGPSASTPSPSVHVDEPSDEPSSTLAIERELVASAWRSLAQGDEAAALATTAEHRRRFEHGLLAPEREAIEVIARCRRGDADRSSRAATFHRAHPGSPLAERVDEACAAPSPRK
ncbi:MAG: hypothetical protein H6712_14275 [Myxococcales bacterium]|nr:hypothetical protein [Myxococcales bacterium]MCB9715029.1 hypothetical protein [Myxococcales bacterium]